MDLNALKQKLDTLQQKTPTGGEKRDYTLTFWRPTVGKQQIRIVPSAFNSKNPFTELKFYYGITNKVMLSPLNYGEKDPIALFAKKLREEYTKENYLLAKKLDAKTRVFVPVVVRGEEDKGVRLFEFSKTIYMELLSIADDEDYGDFTDVAEGFDFVVNASKVQDRPGFALSLRPKPKQTPLSSDASQITTWLENQPILLEERYKYTYDKLKEELQNFISGGEEKEDDIISEPAVGFESETPAKEEKKFTLSTQGTPKKAKSEEFDSLFEDDLPF